MNTPLQLRLNVATNDQLRHAWAFAAKRGRVRFITACSATAKTLGIQPGMTYAQAKTLLPELRVIVVGAR